MQDKWITLIIGLTDENGERNADEQCVLTKDFLVDLSLTDKKDHAKRERYRDYVQSMLVLGEGEAVIDLGVSAEDTTKRGLSKDDLELSEKKHIALLEGTGIISTRLVTKQQGSLYTRAHLVRKEVDPDDFIEVRIAVVGNVDAGKSTLLGVLTYSILDDGRGQARQKHKHEFESGRTSSVGNDILGFDISGNVVNKPDSHSGHLDWVTICHDSAKVITFIDLAGHEKYLKTTIFGMTGHVPDYTMLLIGANAGIIGMTKEHLSLALCLNVPVFIVVTKIDMCPERVLSETMKNLDKLMKSPGVRKLPVVIKSLEDVVHTASNFNGGKVCPIFQISNVSGNNLDLLCSFLNLIPLRRKFTLDSPAEFQIDDVYWVDGVGTVVSGTCIAGMISINDTMLIGPNPYGEFIPIPIKSIHRKRMPVSKIRCGQTASFSIRKLNKKEVRKGMVLLSPKMVIFSSMQFDAEILILHHPTTIAENYQAMVHIGSIRQTATIVHMTKTVLRTGDRDMVTFKFIKNPEYLSVGSRMVFREGRTKAVGTVAKVYPYTPALPKQIRPKHMKFKDGANSTN
ncbi:GTP-binding protein AGP-1 family protein [Onchocerca flexuosa]|uniref:GTP-binding protein AGP-1 family protein n=1 Tax=Onchocerca flexuosa TaxID=387005 RepID=A0A238BWP0_9BILA|nr:GTP-binding protein AGP-1 family protein [Onchocerca flexuosa]